MQKSKQQNLNITDGQNCFKGQTHEYKCFPENIIVYKKDFHYIGIVESCGFVLSISYDETLAYIYALKRLDLILEQNDITIKEFKLFVMRTKKFWKKVSAKTFYDVLFQKQNLSTINTRGFKIEKKDLARSRKYRQAKAEIS